MADNKINVGGRLHSIATGNILAGADEILDDSKSKKQSEINVDVDNALADRYTKDETYDKNQLNSLITTPNVQYVTVSTYNQLPATGNSDTIYKVSSYDGSVIDATKYAEYAWDGSSYVLLSVKSAVDEIFDISVFNAESGIAKKYGTLITALTDIPSNRKKGGMSVKFIQSSDNKYVQYRLAAAKWSIDTNDWVIDEGLYVENSEFVRVVTDNEDKILFGVKSNGEFYFGAGCPEQVKEYIEQKIADLSLDEYEDMVTFLSDYLGSDTTLKSIIDALANIKVNKVDGKSLIDAEYAEGVSQIENTEFAEIHLDAENKILYGVTKNGDFYFGVGVPSQVDEYVERRIEEEEENLSERFDEKVDKVEGKELSSNNYDDTAKDIVDSHSFVEDDTYVDAKIDNTGKLLEYTKADGKKGFTGGVEISGKIDTDCAEVMSSSQNGFVEITTDNEDKIIEGIKSDGKHQFNAGVALSQGQEIKAEESCEWISVVLDDEDKIIEGIKSDGKKFIGAFDETTLNILKDCMAIGSVFKVAMLDSHFDCALPYDVDGIKGSPDAKYTFNLPLGDSWNIRVKFRITEDILNENKTAVLASINGAEVKAYPVPLIQSVTDIGLGQWSMHNTWPATIGGICYNHQTMDNWRRRMNVGRQALSVQYVGEGSAVSLENDGNGLILTIDGTVTTYSFEDYPTMEALYIALKENEDINVNPIALDCHDSSELAKFSAVTLVNTVEGHNNQTYEPEPISFIDKAPFYLHYSLDVDKWHQIEIVKMGSTIYSTCDGNVVTYPATTDTNELVLGGHCGVLFKDLEIDVASPNDAEIINGFIISSVNPYIVIFEGHSMVKYPACEANSNVYNLGTDTLAYVFEVLKQKGYAAVSIEDISDYYTNGRPLPKRCYTMIFDDFEWSIALDPEYRRIFEENGARPALAIITSRETAITHNGTTITKEKASEIAHNAGFSLCTHTRTHRSTYAVAPSDRLDVVKGDILDADLYNINGLVYVYPGGNDDPYMHEVLEYAGVKLGIQIPVNIIANNTLRSRFALNRINIGRVYFNGQKIDFKNNALSRVY